MRLKDQHLDVFLRVAAVHQRTGQVQEPGPEAHSQRSGLVRRALLQQETHGNYNNQIQRTGKLQ